jgi:hypothetical protein
VSRDRRAFLYGLLGTVAGGLIVAGALALIKWLSNVDFFSIFFFGIFPLVALASLVLFNMGERGVRSWAQRVDERLDALEARDERSEQSDEPPEQGI